MNKTTFMNEDYSVMSGYTLFAIKKKDAKMI